MPAIVMPHDKAELAVMGADRLVEFCEANRIPKPDVIVLPDRLWSLGGIACAYYRPTVIKMCLSQCGRPCSPPNSRNWTWPGSTIDREPYGVVAHELGHHVDLVKSSAESRGKYWGDFSKAVRKASGEKRLTNYCPDSSEWFAEMFRLFVTNADLLRRVRPKTYAILRSYFKPVSYPDWLVELGDNVPQRVIDSNVNKFAQE